MKLATRVSAFFLATLAVVLVAFSITLYLLARAHFQRDLDEELVIALDALATSPDPRLQSKPAERSSTAGQDLHDSGVRWAVLDSGGVVVGGCWKLAPVDRAEIYRRRPTVGHIHDSFTDREGRSWRLVVRLAQPAGNNREPPDTHGGALAGDSGANVPPAGADEPLVFAAGAPMGPLEASLRSVAWILAGVSAGAWLLAAAVGRRLCDRALLPVTRMAKAACTMTAADRDKHLPSPGTGDELDGLARSFNGLLDRLQEEFERQKRFTGDASHQLRTPLAALLGQLEVARRRERTAAEYEQTLADVHAEAIRLRQIVDALLFLARAETETGRPELERVELTAWLHEHLVNWSEHPREGDVRAEVTLDGPAHVVVHRQLLGQLVDNLLDNACKYSAPGSLIHVKLESNARVVSLAVEDQGPGIAAKDLPQLFEPFFRSAEARRRGHPGVGLGLAIVKRIASVFGGTIRASSGPERGTRFVLELPAALPPADATRPPDPSGCDALALATSSASEAINPRSEPLPL